MIRKMLYVWAGVFIAFTLFFQSDSLFADTSDGSKGEGTGDRNWVPDTEDPPTSGERYPVEVIEDVRIPMRDGIELEGRLFLPDLPDGEEGACVLYPNGYGHGDPDSGNNRIPRDLAERGYASLHVSMRGSGTSEGEGNLYNKYGEDGYDLVEWMADQSWCDGNVGAIGTSLRGINQWLIAKENPPSLKAISPVVACGDCYDYLWYPGGMLPGPGRVARGEPEYTSAIEHRDFDDWWRVRSTLTEDLQNIAVNDTPALISGGWNDYISSGNVQAYKELSDADGESKLIMGAGAHGAVDDLHPFDFESYQVLWFDRYLKGEPNILDEEEDVLIYVQGPDEWRFEEDWPISDRTMETMYLNGLESKSISSNNDGSFSEEPEDNELTGYDYSPETGPFLHTLLDSGTGRLDIDQSPYEADTTTWTTSPLPDATEVTGSMSLNIWAESDAEDFDIVVHVTDVAPDGTSEAVTAGYLNAPRSESRSSPEPVTPGEVNEYEIEILPTSYVFQKGHRIRLSIAGGTKEHESQNKPQGPGINPNPSSVKIHQDKDHPSSWDIPIIGTATSSAEGSVSSMKALVDYFDEAGDIANQEVQHALQLHLIAVEQFEKQGESKKFIKHMEGFKQLITYHKEKEEISVDSYQAFDDYSDHLIEKWQTK